MSRPLVLDAQPSCGGGLNLSTNRRLVGDTQLVKAVNVRLSDLAADATRRGPTRRTHATALGSGNPVRGGTSWLEPTFVREYVVANGTLYRGVYSIGMSWTSIAAGLSASTLPRFAAGLSGGSTSVLFIADGGLLNKVTSGDVLSTDLASTPAVADICLYNRRLIGVSGTDEFVYWSAPDDGDSLGIAASGGGVARVRTFGDQHIVAVRSIGGALLMFHISGVSRFSGYTQDDISIEAGAAGLSGEVGTIAPHAILEIDRHLIFPSETGFWRVDAMSMHPIATPLETLIRSLDKTNFSRIRAAHHAAFREALWYLPGYGVYCWNYRSNTWTGPWTGGYLTADPYSMWETRDAQNQRRVLFGGDDGFVRVIDPGAGSAWMDDVLSDGTGGAAITMDLEFPPKFFGTDRREKSLNRVYVTYDPGGSQAGYFWTRMGGDYNLMALPASTPFATWDITETWDINVDWPGASGVTEPVELEPSGAGVACESGLLDSGEGESRLSAVTYEAFSMGDR